MDNNFIENLKDIIRRYENDDERQHTAAKQWKLAAELLLEDCERLAFERNALRSELNSRRWDLNGKIDGQAESPKECEATIAKLRSRMLFNETQRANELAKRIDQAINHINYYRNSHGLTVNEINNVLIILNGKDGE